MSPPIRQMDTLCIRELVYDQIFRQKYQDIVQSITAQPFLDSVLYKVNYI